MFPLGRNVYSIVLFSRGRRLSLGIPRWRRFAGAERDSRAVSQCLLKSHCERVRATEHASRDPSNVLERRHSLAEIVERGAGVRAKRLRVIPPHCERECIALSENAARHGNRFAHQMLGFCVAMYIDEGRRVVAGCSEGFSMFLTQ